MEMHISWSQLPSVGSLAPTIGVVTMNLSSNKGNMTEVLKSVNITAPVLLVVKKEGRNLTFDNTGTV